MDDPPHFSSSSTFSTSPAHSRLLGWCVHRREFVTGFRKRRQQRQAVGAAQLAKKERLLRNQNRKEVRGHHCTCSASCYATIGARAHRSLSAHALMAASSAQRHDALKIEIEQKLRKRQRQSQLRARTRASPHPCCPRSAALTSRRAALSQPTTRMRCRMETRSRGQTPRRLPRRRRTRSVTRRRRALLLPRSLLRGPRTHGSTRTKWRSSPSARAHSTTMRTQAQRHPPTTALRLPLPPATPRGEALDHSGGRVEGRREVRAPGESKSL